MRESVIGIGEYIEYKPILNRSEGQYYVVCQHKKLLQVGGEEVWYQTWLPFQLKHASKESEVYVTPRELELRHGVSLKEKLEHL